MTLTFRQSDFSSYSSCRRSWAMQYRLGLHKPRTAPSTAGVGTLVHYGLEHYYAGLPKVGVLGLMRARSNSEREALGEASWLKKFDANAKLAVRMVEGYIDWVAAEGKDVGWQVTAVERDLTVEWPGRPGIFITGRVDLEVTDQYGLQKLVDFKTRASTNPQFADSIDFQRKAYAVMRMLEDGTLYAGAIHRYLKRVLRSATATPPFYGEHEVHFTVEGLRRHFKIMDAMLAEMIPLAQHVADSGAAGLTDTRLYPTPTKDCDWRCPFTDVCDTVDSGGHEWLLNEFYVSGADMPEEANDTED